MSPRERTRPDDKVDLMLLPYFERLVAGVGAEPLELFDIHTHIGHNDPDGLQQTPAELLARLDTIGADAVTFPMHEPSGYPEFNDVALRVATESGGRIRAFCRIDPVSEETDPGAEAERCLDAGAVGIKLHPRAEGFTLGEPGVERLFAIAGERRVPILVHAGRGIPALGRDAVHLTHAHPDARLILAHGGISDLAWLHAEVEPGGNLFFDTAWWNPADLIALFATVPSSQILWASDVPYGTPLAAATWHLRCMVQAGLGEAAIRSIAAGQSRRILAGEEIELLPDPPGEAGALDPMLERVYTHLVSAFGASNSGGDPAEKIDLARLSTQVVDADPEVELLRELEELIDRAMADYLPVEATGEHKFNELEKVLVSLLTLARTPAAGSAAGADGPQAGS
jgi:predicted TIM-barrel fold metal-dependent hydrolase